MLVSASRPHYNRGMPVRFDLFTLFPEMCAAYLQESILKRAQASGLVSVHLHNIRDYAVDKHQVTDDEPYGGGDFVSKGTQCHCTTMHEFRSNPLA